MLRRALLLLLCSLLIGSGALDVVSCRTAEAASLCLSLFGMCGCHAAQDDACGHGQCGQAGNAPALSCPDCGGCTDTVVAELDPAPTLLLALPTPSICELPPAPAPTEPPGRLGAALRLQVPRPPALASPVLRI